MTRITPSPLNGISKLVVGIAVTAGASACTGGTPPPVDRVSPHAPRTAAEAAVPGPLVAEADGVTLTVTVPELVDSRADARIEAVITNDRTEPIALASSECGVRLAVAADVAFPLDPAGDSWPGLEAELKSFVLSQHHSAGGIPESGRMRLTSNEDNCHTGAPVKSVVAAGESAPARATWRPEYVDGLLIPPGEYDVTLTVFLASGQEAAAESVDPTAYLPFDVKATIEIAGDVQPVVSAPVAVDALLEDPQFGRWLTSDKAPWTGANIFLRSAPVASGIVPAGPVWEIDVYRGVGPDQDWAIAFVDAKTGDLASVSLCRPTCGK